LEALEQTNSDSQMNNCSGLAGDNGKPVAGVQLVLHPQFKTIIINHNSPLHSTNSLISMPQWLTERRLQANVNQLHREIL